MNWKEQLKYKYNLATIVEKLIVYNVIMFVLTFAINTLVFLMTGSTNSGGFVTQWLSFPKDLGDFIWRPWSIVTYAFMHSGIFHILSNMIILYFSGQFFLTFYSPKRLVNYYILGAISGALLFSLSYNLFPAFQGTGKSFLIGASAAVMAVLVGVATKAPHLQVRLFFLGNLKLWWIAAFLVVVDFIQIPFGNPGGHLAHIGGALIGYTYTKQLDKGNDIGAWIESCIDWFVQFFNSSKGPKMKTVHKNRSSAKTKKSTSSKPQGHQKNQQKIDDILDKISKSGYDSLTKEEKDFLFKAGKDL